MIVQVCAFFKKTQQEHDVKNMAILRRFIVIEKLKMYVDYGDFRRRLAIRLNNDIDGTISIRNAFHSPVVMKNDLASRR